MQNNLQKIHNLLTSLDSSNIELAKMLANSCNLDIESDIIKPFLDPLLKILKTPSFSKWDDKLIFLKNVQHLRVNSDLENFYTLLNYNNSLKLKEVRLLMLNQDKQNINIKVNSTLLPKFETLIIAHTMLKRINIIQSNIKSLYLDNNKIADFNIDNTSVNNIRILNLSNNSLTKVPSIIWNITNMRYLNLKNNPIIDLNLPNNIKYDKVIHIRLDEPLMNSNKNKLEKIYPNALITI